MALATGTVYTLKDTATTANVNGAGFNPANANMMTDLACDANTGNTASPIVSSATYNFVAGDVGHWVYIKAGTNWTPGWYQIASVAVNKATLKAAVGEAVQGIGIYAVANTVVGCGTVATPTSGTFTIDYSQDNAAILNNSDFALTAGGTTLTSATGGFTKAMIGNLIHLTAGTNTATGWYEIVNQTDTNTVTIDRDSSSGGNMSAATGYVGGAGRLNALEDAFCEMLPAGAVVWISGGHTFTAGINIASTAATTANPIHWVGFASLRGDKPRGTTRPYINQSTFGFILTSNWNFSNIVIINQGAAGLTIGNDCTFKFCRFLNTSTTAARSCFTQGSRDIFYCCEFTSQNGQTTNDSTSVNFYYCYFHDSDNGVASLVNNSSFNYCLFESNEVAAIATTSTVGGMRVVNCTFYGRESKMGIAFSNTTNLNHNIAFVNCIFYGFTTAISFASATTALSILNCDFYNNTTDLNNVSKDNTNLAVDPQFAGATQLTGTTATSSGTTLTDSGADFSSVTDNIDFLHVVSGTGVTVGCYLITGHTGTTLTVNNTLGTSAAGDIVYWITTGHNFAIGANLKAAGVPTGFGSSDILETNAYIDIGAVQRKEKITSPRLSLG